MMNSFLNHDNLLDVNDNICMYMLSKFPQCYTLVEGDRIVRQQKPIIDDNDDCNERFYIYIYYISMIT